MKKNYSYHNILRQEKYILFRKKNHLFRDDLQILNGIRISTTPVEYFNTDIFNRNNHKDFKTEKTSTRYQRLKPEY